MSTWTILFVPHDSKWQPPIAAAKDAEVLLSSFTLYGEVTSEFSDQVEFHHPYANWEGVRCPLCSALIDDDVFYDILDRDHKANHFADLRMTAPCCGSPTSLDRLDYIRPAAFGRFALQIMDPDRDITDNETRRLAACLGTDLHKVWRRI